MTHGPLIIQWNHVCRRAAARAATEADVTSRFRRDRRFHGLRPGSGVGRTGQRRHKCRTGASRRRRHGLGPRLQWHRMLRAHCEDDIGEASGGRALSPPPRRRPTLAPPETTAAPLHRDKADTTVPAAAILRRGAHAAMDRASRSNEAGLRHVINRQAHDCGVGAHMLGSHHAGAARPHARGIRARNNEAPQVKVGEWSPWLPLIDLDRSKWPKSATHRRCTLTTCVRAARGARERMHFPPCTAQTCRGPCACRCPSRRSLRATSCTCSQSYHSHRLPLAHQSSVV